MSEAGAVGVGAGGFGVVVGTTSLQELPLMMWMSSSEKAQLKDEEELARSIICEVRCSCSLFPQETLSDFIMKV